MQYRRLGKAGVKVSALSFGSWVTFGNQVNMDVAKDCMYHAYESGINFFDNAEVYAAGRSEEVMGKIISEAAWNRDSFLVSSKVFWGGDGPNQLGLSRKRVVEACHAALKRLRVDYLDFYFCHRPDKNTPMEETVWAMHNLIQQGKVLYWGTSEWSAQEVQEAMMVARENHLIGPSMEQPQYNMFVRNKVEVEFNKLFRDYGYGSTIWSPLASGILTGKYNNGVPEGSRLTMDDLTWLREKVLTEQNIHKVIALQKIADDLTTSVANLAMAWCLKNEHVSTVITGSTKLSQLQENLKSMDVVEKIDTSVMEAIEAVLDNKPEMPQY
ncbi:MAG TPA: aldo/keto reductase [Flavobacteriales bacterium]|jgi:voltage-dependent potassium channel beta subunit|nr:aldo/keto reductase [Salibacteraceae bacterium]HAQ69816.1 aldo/keto reductase [Flavobacteriales bacterium]